MANVHKKLKTYKGFVIAQNLESGYIDIFSKDEYSQGNGCRYAEMEVSTIEQAIEFIDSY